MSSEPLVPAGVLRSTAALLAELAALSSSSADPEGLRRAAAFLAGAFAERGLATEIEERSGEAGEVLPILRARGPETGDGHLLLLGHLDTVLHATPPEEREGKLFATGAIDMKGGLAAFAGALDLLRERGIAPPPDLLLVVVPDEEVGGTLSREATARWGGQARGVWVLEPGEPRGEAETMVAGRRGMFNWQLEAAGRAAHSGLHYWDGRSALAAAARWCVAAEGLSRRGAGPTVNVGRLVAGEAGFVADLGARHALVGTDAQLNVVPDRALAEGEARFLSAAEGEEVAGRLAALAAEIGRDTGTELVLRTANAVPPVDPHGPHRAWCEKAVALAAARGWRLEVEEERGGISFPNFLPDPGRVPILDGLGPVGGGMHTREEHVDLRSLERRIALLADLLEEDTKANAAPFPDYKAR